MFKQTGQEEYISNLKIFFLHFAHSLPMENIVNWNVLFESSLSIEAATLFLVNKLVVRLFASYKDSTLVIYFMKIFSLTYSASHLRLVVSIKRHPNYILTFSDKYYRLKMIVEEIPIILFFFFNYLLIYNIKEKKFFEIKFCEDRKKVVE